MQSQLGAAEKALDQDLGVGQALPIPGSVTLGKSLFLSG